MKKAAFIFLILASLCLAGCTVSSSRDGERIDPAIRNKVHTLTQELIDGFVRKDKAAVERICSKPLLETGLNLDEIVKKAGDLFSQGRFNVLHEHYNTSSGPGAGIDIEGGTDDNAYNIRLKAHDKETYVVAGYFDHDGNQTCLLLAYGKYADGWKVNILQIGSLRLSHKSATGWYRKVQHDYQQGDLIDATCATYIFNELLLPSGNYWHYKKEPEMAAFIAKVQEEAKAKIQFPITVNDISTHPRIYNIHPERVREGIFPMIVYATSINLKDTVKLAAECDALHKNIGRLFKGMDQNNEMIFYRAADRIPGPQERVEHYGFVRKTGVKE